jgi:ATP-dependent Lhr-like helicase
MRMRAEDLLVKAFPQVLACPETLPPGEMPVPWEQPMVRQTIHDCLTEAMDSEGMLEVLKGLRDGTIRRVAVDTAEPSAFAAGILNAMAYAFLDDAPLEERRTQAVIGRRTLDPRMADTLGALDPAAVAKVREEAWPQPEGSEEVHEALLWMGYVTDAEAAASGWPAWLEELRANGRVLHEDDRWRAVEASRDPLAVLRGRLEALGPVFTDAGATPLLAADEAARLIELETQGVVLRCRLEGRQAWCERRLLARIHRYTLEGLRREIEPVTAAELWRFLASWQHAEEGFRLEGPRGIAEVARKLAGFEAPAAAWESGLLAARIEGYKPEWLDQLTLTGELAWGRLWGAGKSPIRSTPVSLVPREDLDMWLAIAASDPSQNAEDAKDPLSTYARSVLEVLDTRGACFTQELERMTRMLPSHVEMGLAQLIGHGLVTCDSFGGLRRLITPPSRRRGVMKRVALTPAGRWSRFRGVSGTVHTPGEAEVEFVARRLIGRYGVVFRRLIERERIPVPWRDLVRVYRLLELRGDVRGGRFVHRFAGEQYALPEAVELMRRLRRRARGAGEIANKADAARAGITPKPRGLHVWAADPLNHAGILTPDPRVSPQERRRVEVLPA